MKNSDYVLILIYKLVVYNYNSQGVSYELTFKLFELIN